MHQYRMVERGADGKRCLLRCSNNRYHVARALHLVPPVNIPLRGEKPHLGFGILLCQATGSVFRVIFESVNEPQRASGLGRALSLPSTSVWPGDTGFEQAGRLG